MAPNVVLGDANERRRIGDRLWAIYLRVKILDAKIPGGKVRGMAADLIDRMNEQWRQARPDLDPTPLEVVGRVMVLAQHLERSVTAALAPHGLSLGQFDILATLRRQGPAGRLTPTQLMQSVVLSSGGLTNRLDRLEGAGLIAREPDPEDRRGVVVGLTKQGCAAIDAATDTRFAEARASLPTLRPKEIEALADLLRKWLAAVPY